ncbi:MAG: HAD family hydrolase [Candidatus Latescibacteria bacterium]|nr:HAD family hydrolase [Candidatus Latescibacterota bacterium]
MKYTTILFDGYGTLFDKAFDALFDTCQTIVDDLQLDMTKEAFLDHWDRYFFPLLREDDFVTFWDAHVIGLEKTFADLNVSNDPVPYVKNLIDTFGQVPLFPDVKPALNALNGVQTAVVSNADHGHLTSALTKNDLHFPLVISSESSRCYKPNPEIFYDALKELNVTPEKTLYVGDSQEDDIVGTHKAGIDIAWLNRENATRRDTIPEPTYEITSLSELSSILGEE